MATRYTRMILTHRHVVSLRGNNKTVTWCHNAKAGMIDHPCSQLLLVPASVSCGQNGKNHCNQVTLSVMAGGGLIANNTFRNMAPMNHSIRAVSQATRYRGLRDIRYSPSQIANTSESRLIATVAVYKRYKFTPSTN